MNKQLILMILASSTAFSYVPQETEIQRGKPNFPGFGYIAGVDCALAYAGEAYDDQRRAIEDEGYREEQIRELEEDYPDIDVRDRYDNREPVDGPITVEV